MTLEEFKALYEVNSQNFLADKITRQEWSTRRRELIAEFDRSHSTKKGV